MAQSRKKLILQSYEPAIKLLIGILALMAVFNVAALFINTIIALVLSSIAALIALCISHTTKIYKTVAISALIINALEWTGYTILYLLVFQGL